MRGLIAANAGFSLRVQPAAALYTYACYVHTYIHKIGIYRLLGLRGIINLFCNCRIILLAEAVAQYRAVLGADSADG
jgi:hypothetical protein